MCIELFISLRWHTYFNVRCNRPPQGPCWCFPICVPGNSLAFRGINLWGWKPGLSLPPELSHFDLPVEKLTLFFCLPSTLYISTFTSSDRREQHIMLKLLSFTSFVILRTRTDRLLEVQILSHAVNISCSNFSRLCRVLQSLSFKYNIILQSLTGILTVSHLFEINTFCYPAVWARIWISIGMFLEAGLLAGVPNLKEKIHAMSSLQCPTLCYRWTSVVSGLLTIKSCFPRTIPVLPFTIEDISARVRELTKVPTYLKTWVISILVVLIWVLYTHLWMNVLISKSVSWIVIEVAPEETFWLLRSVQSLWIEVLLQERGHVRLTSWHALWTWTLQYRIVRATGTWQGEQWRLLLLQLDGGSTIGSRLSHVQCKRYSSFKFVKSPCHIHLLIHYSRTFVFLPLLAYLLLYH